MEGARYSSIVGKIGTDSYVALVYWHIFDEKPIFCDDPSSHNNERHLLHLPHIFTRTSTPQQPTTPYHGTLLYLVHLIPPLSTLSLSSYCFTADPTAAATPLSMMVL
jgi:hypothetical protein